MATEGVQTAPESELQTLSATIVAVVIAGVAFGAFLHTTGRIESVAGLYGLEGAANGWLVHLAHSFVAGIGFAILATLVPPARIAARVGYEEPPAVVLASVGLGVAYGVVLWAVLVALGVPLWMDAVVGADRPFPYLHGLSLAGLVLFGATFAACFTIVREYVAVDELEGERR